MKLMQIRRVVMFSLILSLNVAEAAGDLSVSGTTTTTNLITKNQRITNVNCTTKANGGALTANASGVVSCSDDDSLEQVAGDPFLVGSASVGSFPESVAVSGRYAYVLNNGGLDVVDVSDPANPLKVGDVSFGGYATFVFVSGRYAYVVDQTLDELIIVDISNPTSPSKVGSIGVGTFPRAVFLSGRYAYLIDSVTASTSDDLVVIDVSDPTEPSQVANLSLGTDSNPRSIYVSGRYAYVADSGTEELKVIDISNPSSPSLTSSFGIGENPVSVYVSGRYAYVVDSTSDDLKVIDVSDPGTLALAGFTAIGAGPTSVFVSGAYAYIVDYASDDIRVVDVADPTLPSEVGRLVFPVSAYSKSVYVSGRYAYVADYNLHELYVIDISGAELPSLNAHSLEAGNLQVRNDIIAQGQLQVTGGVSVGTGGLFSDGNMGISGTVAIANDVAPTSSPANLVQLYARDEKSSSELVVLNEAGIHTVLSPHNFSLVGEPSEPMAWSFYSESNTGKINVDMLRTVRLVEAISGQKLVHTELNDKIKNGAGVDVDAPELPSIESLQVKLAGYQKLVIPLIQTVQELKSENERLARRLDVLEKKPD